jgi:CBS domain-containing protein
VAPTAEEIAKLENRTMTIGELLAMFAVSRRSYETVPQIALALETAGLTTFPSFATGSLDAEIRCVRSASAADTIVPDGSGDNHGDDSDGGELPVGVLPQAAMRIGDLPSARAGLTTVVPGTQLSSAVTLMMQKQISQIGVAEGFAHLHGVVTWESIAAMHAAGKPATLANALHGHPPVCQTTDDLLATLPKVREHGYVIVRDEKGNLSGMVSTADITVEFDMLARPFFTLGEIERRLRRCLGKAFDPADAKAAKCRHEDIDRMEMFDYQKLILHDDFWKKLAWTGIDRDQFLAYLSSVRKVRNSVMHFNVKLLDEQQSAQLKQFAGLLRHIDSD